MGKCNERMKRERRREEKYTKNERKFKEADEERNRENVAWINKYRGREGK